MKISPDDWETQIFMFGPALLPDSESERVEPEDASISGQTDGIEESVSGGDVAVSGNDGPVPTIRLGVNTRTNADADWRLGIDGNPHLLIAGLPGMGKTTCLVNQIGRASGRERV